jgi:hypothetical protein
MFSAATRCTGSSYAHGGHASLDLTEHDADEFRAAHDTPDNATLVVSGHFDPAGADRWIDYLFDDWTGHAIAREAPRAQFRAASLASVTDETQVALDIAFPVTTSDRAAQLVAAEMLSDLAGDVRVDLGATYSTLATLAEQRLSTLYLVHGSIDASSTEAAANLLAGRLARLHGDPQLAAELFLKARNHVLARLGAAADTATTAAARVERDLAIGRPPLSDLATAAAVRDLTIDQMPVALADLELSRAAIAMRGPRDGIKRGFQALGRTPTRLFDDGSRLVLYDRSTWEAASQPFHDVPHDLADPLTRASSPFHFAYVVSIGASLATIEHQTEVARTSVSYAGATLGAELGYRRSGGTRVGLRLAFSTLTGSAPTLSALDVAPFAQIQLSGPFWLDAFAGMHGEWDTSFRVGATVGGEVGLDLIAIDHHWLSVFGQYAFVFNRDADYGAVTFGVAYEH